MSRTREERCQRACDRRRTSPVAPARSPHRGASAGCATRVAPGLAPGRHPAPGREAPARRPPGDRRLAGDGVGGGAPWHQRPSRLEPGPLVRAPRPSAARGPAHQAAGPVGSHERARRGRPRGAPLGTAERGQRRRAGVCCPDLAAPPGQSLPWVVRRGAVEGTGEEARAPLGLEPQRPWSDQASAQTTPVRLALGSPVTGRAWQLRHSGPMPVPATAWYRTAAPTVADCLAVVRGPRWRAREVVHATPEAAWRPCPPEGLARLLHGVP
ncbi:MAG: hypothetical protein ACRERE_30895 [Candidatus Entotheonellia bacterium]